MKYIIDIKDNSVEYVQLHALYGENKGTFQVDTLEPYEESENDFTSMKITKEDCYKAVSDLINENYPYFDDCEDTGASIQYLLGLNDMARYLAEMMDSAEEECDDNRRKERT